MFDLNQVLYETVQNGILRCAQRIWIDKADPSLINIQLKKLLEKNPQIFWFDGRWKWIHQPEGCWMEPIYRLSIPEIQKAQKKIRATLYRQNELAAASDFEKICGVYDWILENVSYGIGKSDGQTIYEALVLREAVCKGMAKSVQLLLGQLGVETWLCSGTLDGKTRHIWNAVCLNETIYQIDVSLAYPCFDLFFEESERENRNRGRLLLEGQLWQLHQKISRGKEK